MRVKCANCGAIWEFITIWTAQNDEKCQGRPHQTGCPCCGSNAYEQVPEGTHRNSQEGTLECDPAYFSCTSQTKKKEKP